MDKIIAEKLAERDSKSQAESVEAFHNIFKVIASWNLDLTLRQREELEEAVFKFGNTRRLIGEERIDYYVEIAVESALRFITIYNNSALAVRELLNLRSRGYVFDVPDLQKHGGTWFNLELEQSNNTVTLRLENS